MSMNHIKTIIYIKNLKVSNDEEAFFNSKKFKNPDGNMRVKEQIGNNFKPNFTCQEYAPFRQIVFAHFLMN